jgi:hypothetical protein
MTRRVAVLAALEVERGLDAVLRRPRLAHEENEGRVLQQDRVGHLLHQLHRVVVEPARLAEQVRVLAQLRIRVLRALDREHDVVGAERRAVVELDAMAQVEAPGGVVQARPRHCRARHDGELLVALHQRVVHLLREEVGQAFVLRVRVARLRIALRGPAKRPRAGVAERHGRAHRGCDEDMLHGTFLS